MKCDICNRESKKLEKIVFDWHGSEGLIVYKLVCPVCIAERGRHAIAAEFDLPAARQDTDYRARAFPAKHLQGGWKDEEARQGGVSGLSKSLH